MIFDTHTHLAHFKPGEIGAVRERARAAGVSRIMSATSEVPDILTARAGARAHAGEHYSAGLHPGYADRLNDQWAQIEALAREPDCSAIGETGLDLHWDDVPLATQVESMERHLTLARELDLPVILHVRDAYSEAADILRRHPGLRGVYHCFNAAVDEARVALDLGFYLSFAGPLTYKSRKNDALREAAAFAPPDRLLVETDAPSLAPQGKRGRANEPAFITITVQKLADVRGWTFEETARRTMENGRRLFRV